MAVDRVVDVTNLGVQKSQNQFNALLWRRCEFRYSGGLSFEIICITRPSSRNDGCNLVRGAAQACFTGPEKPLRYSRECKDRSGARAIG